MMMRVVNDAKCLVWEKMEFSLCFPINLLMPSNSPHLCALFLANKTRGIQLVRRDRLASCGHSLSIGLSGPERLQRERYVAPLPPALAVCLMRAGIDKFIGVLHEAIHSALQDGVDDVQKNGAIQTQQGWMHIHGKSSPLSYSYFQLTYADAGL